MSNVNWAGLGWFCVFVWAAGCTAVCVWISIELTRQLRLQRRSEAVRAVFEENYRLAYITACVDQLELYRQCPELPEAERQELETACREALHAFLFEDVVNLQD